MYPQAFFMYQTNIYTLSLSLPRSLSKIYMKNADFTFDFYFSTFVFTNSLGFFSFYSLCFAIHSSPTRRGSWMDGWRNSALAPPCQHVPPPTSTEYACLGLTFTASIFSLSESYYFYFEALCFLSFIYFFFDMKFVILFRRKVLLRH